MATIPSGHRTYRIVDDPTARSGKCAVQTTERQWTLGQSVQWSIGKMIGENPEQAWRLRARIKVRKTGDHGNAFSLGFYYYNQNWSGNSCAPELVVKAKDMKHDEWVWIDYPHPLKYKKYDRPQLVAVRAANNAENIESVSIDEFEIYPEESN